MNTSETIPTDRQTPKGDQAQKRAWVTPAFEQVALKDALNTPNAPESLDATTLSS